MMEAPFPGTGKGASAYRTRPGPKGRLSCGMLRPHPCVLSGEKKRFSIPCALWGWRSAFSSSAFFSKRKRLFIPCLFFGAGSVFPRPAFFPAAGAPLCSLRRPGSDRTAETPAEKEAVLCVAEGAAAQDGAWPFFLPPDGWVLPSGPGGEVERGLCETNLENPAGVFRAENLFEKTKMSHCNILKKYIIFYTKMYKERIYNIFNR